MKSAYAFSLTALFALGATSPMLIGCEEDSAVEEIGEDIDEGIEEVEDEVDDATTD